MAQITAERAGLYGHIKADHAHQAKGIWTPCVKNKLHLFCAENLPIADFNAKCLMAINASHDRRSITGVRFVSACAAAFGTSNGNWSGNVSHEDLL